ncbi:MAG: sigma-54-dependent Fis family transcriptional regulator [Deltaproteobacteria bacterium]|nr:sigma-54-dependent Fis family transcriptional regulator [Deltaproteobacteria bacterium]
MTNKNGRILVVDDEEPMRHSLETLLRRQGYETVSATDGQAGLDTLESAGPFDAVLCDLRMPNVDGMEFVRRAVESGHVMPIVVMSAYGSIDNAVEAMRMGAYSFVSKPFKPGEIAVVLGKALAHEALVDENRRLREEQQRQNTFEEMVGRDDRMREVFDAVQKIAPYKTSVLITGESGTGKELVARSIHRRSARAGAFVAVNCGAIPENLLESELFGHVKGAFTDARFDKAGLFVEADGGTMFLDEIGEMPKHLQVKLLRALQEEEIRPVGGGVSRLVDVRIVAATQLPPADLVRDTRLREDLYYRLAVFPIHIPPLRDRPGDIPLLVEHFVKVHRARMGIRVQGVRQKALSALMEYNWPGNVRELENVIERAMVLAGSGYVETEHLSDVIRLRRIVSDAGVPEQMPLAGGELSIKQNSRYLEEVVIRKALAKTRGNRTTAARMLEISHRTLLYKIQEYQIDDL